MLALIHLFLMQKQNSRIQRATPATACVTTKNEDNKDTIRHTIGCSHNRLRQRRCNPGRERNQPRIHQYKRKHRRRKICIPHRDATPERRRLLFVAHHNGKLRREYHIKYIVQQRAPTLPLGGIYVQRKQPRKERRPQR